MRCAERFLRGEGAGMRAAETSFPSHRRRRSDQGVIVGTAFESGRSHNGISVAERGSPGSLVRVHAETPVFRRRKSDSSGAPEYRYLPIGDPIEAHALAERLYVRIVRPRYRSVR